MALFDSLKDASNLPTVPQNIQDMMTGGANIMPAAPGVGSVPTTVSGIQPAEQEAGPSPLKKLFDAMGTTPPAVPKEVAGTVSPAATQMGGVDTAKLIGRLSLLASLFTGGMASPFMMAAGMAGGASNAMMAQKRQMIQDALKARQLAQQGAAEEATTDIRKQQLEDMKNPPAMTPQEQAKYDLQIEELRARIAGHKAAQARMAQQNTVDKQFASELAKITDPKTRMRLMFQWKNSGGLMAGLGGADTENLLNEAFPTPMEPGAAAALPGEIPSPTQAMPAHGPTGKAAPKAQPATKAAEKEGELPTGVAEALMRNPGQKATFPDGREYGVRNGKVVRLK